jgi:hypothetical protein
MNIIFKIFIIIIIIGIIKMNNLYDINKKDLNKFLNKYQTCNIIESIHPPSNKIIAIGDIHGDFDVIKLALTKAEVIDKNDNWIGGDSIVVQVGDVFDGGGRGESRCNKKDIEEVKILEFLYDLNRKAQLHGGKVISLIGNHELMNILGDFRYVSKEHIEAMGGLNKRRQILKPGGILAKKIACNSLGIVKIGDWVFVHGGLLPEHFNINKKKKTHHIIYQINNLVRGIILGDIKLHDITANEEDIIFGGNGIFWTRKYSNRNHNSDDKCKTLLKTLELLKIDKNKGGMVVGHTPQDRINSVCNNKIWRVDTGMSKAFGERYGDDRIEILIIHNNGERFETK